jgi:glucokinase
MKEQPRKAIGVDFGGTSVKLAIVHDSGEVLGKSSIATASLKSVDEWLESVAGGIDVLLSECGASMDEMSGVGVGVPGFVDFERGHIYDLTNVPGWTDVALAKLLRQRFGLRSFVDNDVNAMALGESLYGAGRGMSHALFVTLGTGVGGGIVIDGRLYRGAYSMAGELGHVSIDRNGIKSPQGQGGLEQYVGNRRIVERAVDAMKKGRASKVIDLVDGELEKVTPKILAAAADEKDELALEVFDFMADCLATAFASVVYLLQPQVLIIGGGVAQSGEVLFGPLRRHLEARLSPFFAERIEVRHAELGNDAGIIGSASLAWQP